MSFMFRIVTLSALSCLIGCAAAQPKPETGSAAPTAAPSRSGDFFIRVIDLPGWAQSPESGPGGFLLVNPVAAAQVQIATFTKTEGEPRDAVGWLMVRLAAQGADIGEMTGIEPGAQRPRLTFSVRANGVRINGLAAAKWSRVDGIGFLVVGMWPAVNEPALLSDFERMFETVDIYEQ